MVMASCPVLVCAPALAANKQSKPPTISHVFRPPNWNLQFIASGKSGTGFPFTYLLILESAHKQLTHYKCVPQYTALWPLVHWSFVMTKV